MHVETVGITGQAVRGLCNGLKRRPNGCRECPSLLGQRDGIVAAMHEQDTQRLLELLQLMADRA